MLSIFSGVCWSSVHLFWRSVCLCFLLIFMGLIIFWVLSCISLYILDTTPLLMSFENISSNSQRNLEKENQSWWYRNSNFKLHYRDVVIKTVCLKINTRALEQNRIPRNKPTIIWSVNLQQSTRKYPLGKRKYLQQVVLRKLNSSCKRMKLDHFFISYTKINSKWIKDLNMRLETMEILE